VGPDGNVFVADRVRDRVQRFRADGLFEAAWGLSGGAAGQLVAPQGVVVGDDGTVYVAHSGNHRIQAFTPDGEWLRLWGTAGSAEGAMMFPAGLAFADTGTLAVVDRGNHRVQLFGVDGRFVDAWGSEGASPGQMRQPQGIDVAPDGSLYVTDLRNNRVQRFDRTGSPLSVFGSIGSGPGEFAWPTDVAIGPDGLPYVTDSGISGGGNNRVQRFDLEGAPLGGWGGSGSLAGEMDDPQGIAFGPGGVAYVADMGNHRVQAFGPAPDDAWRLELYGNRFLAERPVAIERAAEVSFDWGSDPPAGGVPADGFSARAVRVVRFESGRLELTLDARGAARLWLGRRLLVDRPGGLSGPQRITVPVAAGDHEMRLEYADLDGPASVHLEWQMVERLPAVFLPLAASGR
jgi:DNA-binding beta-propeller fold protein YncE